jgi:uncharacterized membrane protein YbhN (UPF0104 family)
MKLDPRLQRAITWLRMHSTWLSIGLMVVVLGIAGTALFEILQEVKVDDIRQAFAQITTEQILLSIGLTILSFFILSFYDVMGLSAIGKPQPYWRALFGSFTAYNLSHNLGFAPITGAAARWRAYRGTNIDAADVARLVVIAGVTFWLGIFLMLGVFLVLFPGALRVHDATMPYWTQAAIGAAILAGIAVYLVACARQTGPLNILGWTLPVPTLRQALTQFSLAATDIAVASMALLVLLPPDTWHHYPDFLVAYVVAVVVALLAHAPGGIGVFEAVVLVTLPEVDKPALISALILYRLIYYWGPLLIALALLGINELWMWRRRGTIQQADRDERISTDLTL